MKYILALDIGIASVGWAVLDKESETVIEAGSNIFPEASAADNQLRRDMRGRKEITGVLKPELMTLLNYGRKIICQSRSLSQLKLLD